jgi:hypothetical protein
MLDGRAPQADSTRTSFPQYSNPLARLEAAARVFFILHSTAHQPRTPGVGRKCRPPVSRQIRHSKTQTFDCSTWCAFQIARADEVPIRDPELQFRIVRASRFWSGILRRAFGL